MVSHIVLFTPRNDVSIEESASLLEAINQASRDIPGVIRANVGKRIKVGAGYEDKIGLSTYEYAAVIEFRDTADLLTYLSHPVHQELGRLFWVVCESTMIVDVEMQPAGALSVEGMA